MNCLLRPDLCDEIRRKIQGKVGLIPTVPQNDTIEVPPYNSSDGLKPKETSWTPPISKLFQGNEDGDLTSHVITALLLFLLLAYLAYFLGMKQYPKTK